jgi:hypothetical protein
MTKQEFIKQGVYCLQIYVSASPSIKLGTMSYKVRNYTSLTPELIKQINESEFGIIIYHPKISGIKDDEFIRLEFLLEKVFANEPYNYKKENFEIFYNKEIQ